MSQKERDAFVAGWEEREMRGNIVTLEVVKLIALRRYPDAPPPDAGGLQEAFVQGALWENPNINGTKATAAATDHYAPQREGGGK